MVSNPRSAELIHAEQLISKAKFEEALENIQLFEKNKNASPNDKLFSQLLRGYIYLFRHHFREVIKIGEGMYETSQKLGALSYSIEALVFQSYVVHQGKINKSFDIILKAEDLLNSIVNESAKVFSNLKTKVFLTKSWIFYYMGEYEKGLTIAINCLTSAKNFNEKFLIAQSLEVIGNLHLSSGQPNTALEYATKSLNLYREFEYSTGIASIFSLFGLIYYYKGDLENSTRFCELSLSEKGISSVTKVSALNRLGRVFKEKGELDRALDLLVKSSDISKEIESISIIPANAFIGAIYRMKGEYNLSIKYLKKNLILSEDTGWTMANYLILLELLNVCLDIDKPKQANLYLTRMKDIADQRKSKIFTQTFLLAKALLLKAKNRRQDRAEAQKILLQIVEEEILNPQVYVLSVISLCELYLEELSFYNNPDILDDISPLINRLLHIAERQDSSLYLAESKLLHAKLALIQMDIDRAKVLLTQAQKIAEKRGLSLLAQKISSEHDILLDKTDRWENLKDKDALIAERIDLASFDGIISRLQGKSVVEPPELVDEEPILLIIMDNSGVTYFNHTFVENWDFSDLFSSFMSAFNTFTGEIFSKSIDRVKVGENTILIDPIEPFLACYVIKGQSYPAQQKLSRFSDAIKASTEIWEALNRAVKTSEMLELDNPPSLGSTVNEIFV